MKLIKEIIKKNKIKKIKKNKVIMRILNKIKIIKRIIKKKKILLKI